MSKLNIALIFGGHSLEHDISIRSFKNVAAALDPNKYNLFPIYITKDAGHWFLYDGNLNNLPENPEKFGTPVNFSTDKGTRGLYRIVGDKFKTLRIDVAFPVLHGNNGEDGTIQGLFEMAGIPYVGCGVLASALAMDKSFAKIVTQHAGVPVTPYMVYHQSDEPDLETAAKDIKETLGFPCFVKPANGGSSVGISKVKTKKQLTEAFAEAFRCDSKLIVEKFIKAKEVECAVLETPEGLKVSQPGEIIVAASGDFYGYEEKYHNPDSRTLIPAKISEEVAQQISDYALTVFKAIGGKGLSRVDFFLESKTNQIYFNEINTLPGFTNISMYPELAASMGYSYSDLLNILIESSLTHG